MERFYVGLTNNCSHMLYTGGSVVPVLITKNKLWSIRNIGVDHTTQENHYYKLLQQIFCLSSFCIVLAKISSISTCEFGKASNLFRK